MKIQILSAEWRKRFYKESRKNTIEGPKIDFSFDTWDLRGIDLKFEGGQTHKNCRYWVKKYFLKGAVAQPSMKTDPSKDRW